MQQIYKLYMHIYHSKKKSNLGIMCLRAHITQSKLDGVYCGIPGLLTQNHILQATCPRLCYLSILFSGADISTQHSLVLWPCPCLISFPSGGHNPNRPFSLPMLRGCPSLLTLFSFLHPGCLLTFFDLLYSCHINIFEKHGVILKRGFYKATCVYIF